MTNPYAPPREVTGPVEAATATWKVQGEHLLVQDGTILPPLDLAGSLTGGPLTPVLIPLGAAQRAVPGSPIVLATARGQMAVPALRVQARRWKWRKRLFWGATAIIWIHIFTTAAEGTGTLIRGLGGSEDTVFLCKLLQESVGLLMLIAAWIWSSIGSGVKCSGVRDGWSVLKGIPPETLAEFARRAWDPPPPRRLRKVHRIFAYRLSLPVLITRAPGNPLMWLIAASLKAQRSSQLVQWYFHWSEARPRPVAECDPDLLATWKKDAAGTVLATWTGRWSERLDMPFSGYRTSSLVLASPDGKHFAVASVVRDATASGFVEINELHFLSWTGDGPLLDTSSSPTMEPSPVNRHHLRVRGRTAAVWNAHLLRAGEVAVALRDDAELLERLSLAAEQRHEALEAAGVFGPVEEMDLPDDAAPYPAPPPMPEEQMY